MSISGQTLRGAGLPHPSPFSSLTGLCVDFVQITRIGPLWKWEIVGKNCIPHGGKSHPHSPSPPLARRASAEWTALGRDSGGGGLDQLGLRLRRHQQAPQHE